MDLYRTAREFPYTLGRGRALLSAEELRETGSTRSAQWWQVHHGQLGRPFRGAYLRGGGSANLLDAARAALMVAPPGAVLGFHTAAALLGFGVVEDTNIHIVVPAGYGTPQRGGITAHQSVVPVGEPAQVLGLPCTPPARCAIDLARTLPPHDALPVLDAALQAGDCETDTLLGELKEHDSLKGIRQARDLVPLADARPECRQESQLRLIIHDGGLRGFVPQVAVSDEHGRVRYYLDLADPASRVVAEYDGASHLDRARLRADRERHNWLESRGWRMRYFTDRDLYPASPVIIHTLLTARSRAKLRDR
jgi:very-short-patch-repair endonuclease